MNTASIEKVGVARVQSGTLLDAVPDAKKQLFPARAERKG